MDKKEKVLCVSSEYFNQVVKEEGFIIKDAQKIVETIFQGLDEKESMASVQRLEHPVITKKNHIGFVERGECEFSADYKQIIPYGIIAVGTKDDPKILSYFRSTQTGDTRLKGKCSIGFGGHCNLKDYNKSSGCVPLSVSECLYREFHEELTGFARKHFDYNLIGIINDNSSEVNSRHVGLVFVVYPQTEKLKSNEDSITGLEIMSYKETEWYYDDMEKWSQLVFDKIQKEKISFAL